MKLISNKSTGTLFRQVAEIDENKADWSAEHPHVCHGISPFVIPGTDMVNGPRAWFFAFKAIGGRRWVMYPHLDAKAAQGFD